MIVVKLVKNYLVLIVICAEILHIKGMRTNNEEEPDTPDANIIYDQRQSGKYNIHVVIKDVAIIEMDQNEISDQIYNDEEYYYDEDDLTVKPLNIKPTTTVIPVGSSGENKTTIPISETTISFSESQSVEPTTKSFQETLGYSLSANVSTSRPSLEIKSRSKIEPIYDTEEPVLQPRHQLQSRDSNYFKNSRIFKVKVHRTHRAPQITPQRERCRSYQYRNARGNCLGKRSSSGSILKRLFRMLVTLPFKQDEQLMDD